MIKADVEHDDIETLAQILEREKILHNRKCMLCFVMFLFAFSALVVALVIVGVQLASIFNSPISLETLGSKFAFVQVLATLAGVALLFFGNWWAAQNCLNAIERTLCAARNQRLRLFKTFLGEIRCAGDERRQAWLEIVKSIVT